MPMQGKRERDVRNRFTLPDYLSLKNFSQTGFQELPDNVAGSGLAAYVASLLDPALTWKDIEWLLRVTKLPVLVKGILRADDALRAVNHGASGIIVSNHGARQLDTTPATISILPEIVDAVAGAVEVYIDGGIRRGTDVLKAMAYGARAVLVGRPILWGLAVAGEAGVKSVLEMLRQEFDLAMALSGCPRLTAITRDLVRPLSDWDRSREVQARLARLRSVSHPATAAGPGLRNQKVRISLKTDLGPEFRHPHILILHKIISRRAVVAARFFCVVYFSFHQTPKNCLAQEGRAAERVSNMPGTSSTRLPLLRLE